MSTLLDARTFALVVESAPLISIDLLAQDRAGRFLLGRRNNAPARGAWFVPGGRVLKDERLDAAFLRITASEIGRPVARSEASFAGVYEHLYSDGFAGATVSTHYVVLAYALGPTDLDVAALPGDQHGSFRLATRDEILRDPEVHRYTRDYFVEAR